MTRFLFSFILGWIVTTWLAAELFYFIPSAEPVVDRVSSAISIPTHNQWDLKKVDREFERVAYRIEQTPLSHLVPETLGKKTFFGENRPTFNKINTPSHDANDDAPYRWEDFTLKPHKMDLFRDILPYIWIQFQ